MKKQGLFFPFRKEALYWEFWNTFLEWLPKTVEMWTAGPGWARDVSR